MADPPNHANGQRKVRCEIRKTLSVLRRESASRRDSDSTEPQAQVCFSGQRQTGHTVIGPRKRTSEGVVQRRARSTVALDDQRSSIRRAPGNQCRDICVDESREQGQRHRPGHVTEGRRIHLRHDIRR